MAAVAAPGIPIAPPGDAPTASARYAASPELAAFYAQREFAPLWMDQSGPRPETARLVQLLKAHRRPSQPLETALRAAQVGGVQARTQAELMASEALAGLAAEINRAPIASAMRFAPAAAATEMPLTMLAPTENDEAALDRLNGSRRLLAGLARGLDRYRRAWGGLPTVRVSGDEPAILRRRLGLAAAASDGQVQTRLRDFQRIHGLRITGRSDATTIAALNRGAAHYERLIRLNIERARAIPAQSQGRYILVDTASQRLWMIEDGRIAGAMRVVVGKPGRETPEMADTIRNIVLNPYWIVPQDLVRERARNVLRRGVRAISAERLQVMSDWSRRARARPAARVDWRAVAAGRRTLALRQSPGPHNMMGAIKFEMPNPFGIYLHDTPLRDVFARADRRASSGCVRLEDAPRLARWLFRGAPPRASGAPEQRL
ncbi:MAG: L,D-transpeptidase family protein, partial [Sphingosinicella sp.]